MSRTIEDYTLAGEIIDAVLANSAMHKLPQEKGMAPTFCLGLELGDAVPLIAGMIAEYRREQLEQAREALLMVRRLYMTNMPLIRELDEAIEALKQQEVGDERLC